MDGVQVRCRLGRIRTVYSFRCTELNVGMRLSLKLVLEYVQAAWGVQIGYTCVWMALCSELNTFRKLYGPSVLLKMNVVSVHGSVCMPCMTMPGFDCHPHSCKPFSSGHTCVWGSLLMQPCVAVLLPAQHPTIGHLQQHRRALGPLLRCVGHQSSSAAVQYHALSSCKNCAVYSEVSLVRRCGQDGVDETSARHGKLRCHWFCISI